MVVLCVVLRCVRRELEFNDSKKAREREIVHRQEKCIDGEWGNGPGLQVCHVKSGPTYFSFSFSLTRLSNFELS